ncbi:MAG: hypothetical protein COT74_01325 [Bdellovibrionales bacterium CG10_big_fil_rev_8_21_14_0_10_45_34]|nr:MAG: hypothetical protein COT74_01325 [Bdellovibrionales bacterium CG10_big_fil_rev_8_21_14_0_10_45_34]
MKRNRKILLHLRRCHVCGAVTESESKIEKCHSCGKAFAPFFYYDDSAKPLLSDNGFRPNFGSSAFPPLYGLTAYWEVSGAEGLGDTDS